MQAVVSRLSGDMTSVVMLRVAAPTEKKVEEKFGEIFFDQKWKRKWKENRGSAVARGRLVHSLASHGIDLKRITRCKLALIFTSADHRQFLGLFGSEAARL